MAYITLDFGSSNSGAVLNTALGNEYNPADLIYVHRQDGDAGFTKQPTVFWIKRALIEKTSICCDDINVFSCVFHEEELYFDNANFVWCQNQVKKSISKLAKDKDWVRIQHPKMELYKLGNNSPANTRIQANDGNYFPLIKILKIFFLVIKKECLHKASEAGLVLTEEEINWGITVPGLAIWNQEAVSVIKEVAYAVFGEKVTLWSEPECALIGLNLSGRAKINFVEDRYSLIVDLGGGTADICVMQETLNSDGTTTFDEVKSTEGEKDSTTSERAGGNDIDRNFKSFFCEYLSKEIEINDTPIWLYANFLAANPKGAMEFEERWHRLQFSDEIDEPVVHFNPGRAYSDWLMIHCPSAAKKKDEYGEFSLNGEELREYVFEPIYDKILKSIEENLLVLKKKHINLDAIYFAGGLSLDKKLKKLIKSLSKKLYPYVQFIETSTGSVVGAVQRGGNHIAANKETLIRRMSRKTFYTEFAKKFDGNMNDLRDVFKKRIQYDYCERFGMWLSEADINEKLDEQWENKIIDDDGSVSYYSPLCLRFAPVTRVQSFEIVPYSLGSQTGVAIKVFSSDKNFILFKNEDITEEGEFEYEFGFNWKTAKLVFDPISNAVEGTALFYLADENGKKLKEFVINNVSKRGF